MFIRNNINPNKTSIKPANLFVYLESN